MRFSLQDVKKSIHRRGSELILSLHFLRSGEFASEIEQLIAYHERFLGQPQRLFSLDDARACAGDYRLAHCLVATLSHWYSWRQRVWLEVVQEIYADNRSELLPNLIEIGSSVQLRLMLYNYVNEQHSGFLNAHTRNAALQQFAEPYHLSVEELEYLLALDSDDEAVLTRVTAHVPTMQEVANLYNQWAFEAALFNASHVRFVVDCQSFGRAARGYNSSSVFAPAETPTVGVGAVIKRLCYLARKLGVYYDIAYEPVSLTRPINRVTTEHDLAGHATSGDYGETGGSRNVAGDAPLLLSLTLYGPQEVTGVPQQYGLRLARLCRLLMGYGLNRVVQNESDGQKKRVKKPSFSSAIVEATATVHFLQRSYLFKMDAVMEMLYPVSERNVDGAVAFEHDAQANTQANTQVFDSSIEASFAEAFTALACSQGVDGWRLEREPEPLLLERSIFIPDFALTRAQQRIYVEILGFWTPAYRERKIQKLQQLQERNDLLLAIPIEAREAFATIATRFRIVYYSGQLSATDVIQALRSYYDDFTERLKQIDVSMVRARVRTEGLIAEQACYRVLHCYRRSELQQAAELVTDASILFMAGVGLYCKEWMEQIKSSFIGWLNEKNTVILSDALEQVKNYCVYLDKDLNDVLVETMIGIWSEVQVCRDSIFEARVKLAGGENSIISSRRSSIPDRLEITEIPEKETRRREKRNTTRKRLVTENTVQDDLWK